MAESHRETLFTPFARGGADSKVDGFGLGLYIVQSIAALHGGRVSFEKDHSGRSACVLVLSRVAGP